MASVAISGVLWGAAGGLFYVADQPEQGLFLALLIVGMCAAATASLSYHRIAYPVFLLPAITPIMLHLISDEKLTANAVGFVIPFYFTLLYLLSQEIYRAAHESILGRINSQYQAMFDHLTGVANRRGFEEALEPGVVPGNARQTRAIANDSRHRQLQTLQRHLWSRNW